MKYTEIKVLKKSCNENTEKSIESNFKLIEKLVSYKNMIGQYTDKTWDEYKKYTNDYELIFTQKDFDVSVCKMNPISRSFFKLWEIISEFSYHFNGNSNKCFFIAEGPGGFVEAYSKWRYNKLENDTITVNTLVNAENKNIPTLKIPKWIYNKTEIQEVYGKDMTGNICDIENINSIIDSIGLNTCNVVTGDGGFDFSVNFNNQEQMSMLLIACQIYIAINVQKANGIFVIKMYDISLMNTMKLINILYDVYNCVYITKPCMSRPANSEKYFICTNFNERQRSKYIKPLYNFIQSTIKGENAELDIQLNQSLVSSIFKFNSEFVWNQIVYIMKTMNFIDKKDIIDLVKVKQYQIKKAKKWCKQNRLPYL